MNEYKNEFFAELDSAIANAAENVLSFGFTERYMVGVVGTWLVEWLESRKAWKTN